MAPLSHLDRPRSPHLAPEAVVWLEVNGRLEADWLCTPHHLDVLAAGWLRGEGYVLERREILDLEVDPEFAGVRARVAAEAVTRGAAARGALHGGPGARAFSVDRLPGGPSRASPALAGRISDPGWLQREFARMFELAVLRGNGGGVHTGALAGAEGVEVVAEDVGRHNVVDRLIGAAFLQQRPLAESCLLLSGRISGLDALKAARAGVAALASISIPTSLARDIARRAGLTLIGRARGSAPQIHDAD